MFCSQLASLLLQEKEPVKALSIADDLLSELRKLDDKQMLTEVHLTEARIYHSLRNIPKCERNILHVTLNSINLNVSQQKQV